jgi:hypothetical protein
MEKWEHAQKEALENINKADHMLNVTYRLLCDPKLLLMALKRIDVALKMSVKSLIYIEQHFKRIPDFHEKAFDSSMEILEKNVSQRYKIKRNYLKLVKEVNNIVSEHDSSPMEFVRHDKLVICSDNYGMQVLSEDRLKSILSESKAFIKNIAETVSMKSD